MRLLDKYILKNIAGTYLFILLVFVGLYFIIDIFSNISDILKAKPNLYLLVSYYFNMLPLILLRVSMLALLIGTLYVLGELNKNNEIINMRSSGISILRISLPVIFFAVLISFSALFIQEKIVIYSQKKADDIKIQFIKKDFSKIPEEKNFSFISEEKIFFTRQFLPKEGTMKDVTIFEENSKGLIIKKTTCRNIIYKNNSWEGENIMEYNLDESGNIIDKPFFWGKKIIDLRDEPKKLILKKSAYSELTSLQSLRKEIIQLKRLKATNILADRVIRYNEKLTSPFSHLFIIIAIIPFTIEIRKKKVALSALGMGFIFGFTYYFLNSFSISLGQVGIILPVFSAWIAPLFTLSMGITGLMLIK